MNKLNKTTWIHLCVDECIDSELILPIQSLLICVCVCNAHRHILYITDWCSVVRTGYIPLMLLFVSSFSPLSIAHVRCKDMNHSIECSRSRFHVKEKVIVGGVLFKPPPPEHWNIHCKLLFTIRDIGYNQIKYIIYTCNADFVEWAFVLAFARSLLTLNNWIHFTCTKQSNFDCYSRMCTFPTRDLLVT